ncbi:FecCD family ABC transporter permease [Nocardia gamkensis]|uniref:Iron ABC transporter permease n=1 Tax=Nocardia gamkensis TaxID=352869 RepID=A0A7X6R1B2_9NOCA|nr:iron ABC transporter permease [Nocardia gamkensis]NKY24997.1 iron ABC transporter permease [Nocardia gamkensis]NQE66784.1 Fe(3+) dicitrate transport system permease protein FecC [Nocardia gamkensis]
MTPLATVRRRRLSGLLVSTVLLLLAVLAGVAVGARSLAPGTVYDAVHHALTCPGGPFACAAGSTEEQIVRGLRLPRTALALVCGSALGIAGALIQGYTRNPLADAGLLGLNAGAAFLAALSTYLFAFSAPEQYIWFAFAGALIAGVVVFATSSVGGGKASPLSLVLGGAAVTAFLQAMTNAVVLFDASALDTYRFWVIGTVAGRDAAVFWQVLPFLAAGMLLAVLAAPGLNVLGLGDDVARGLGVHVGRSRALGLASVVLLTGAATAAVGPIAFLGLVVPHLARAVTGPDNRWLIPYSGLFGALLLLSADVAGRLVARPGELEVGVMLAVVGVPFFLAFVRRRKLVNL